MLVKTKDNFSSSLKILTEKLLLLLFLTNSEVDSKFALLNHQDSEITEETPCKILLPLPELSSSVMILVLISMMLILMFLEPASRLSSLKTTAS